MTQLNTQTIAAGAGALCAFVGSITGLPIPFGVVDILVGLGLAAGTGVGLYLVIPESQPKQASVTDRLIEEIVSQPGIDKAEVAAAIRLGQEKLKTIRAAAAEIRNPNAARRVRSICGIGDKILEDFKQDPRDVRVARTWLNSYLDQTIDVVQGYANLSKNAAGRPDAVKAMTSFEETLDALDGMFKKQLDALLANDVQSFEVNAQVFTNMIKQEGI